MKAAVQQWIAVLDPFLISMDPQEVKDYSSADLEQMWQGADKSRLVSFGRYFMAAVRGLQRLIRIDAWLSRVGRHLQVRNSWAMAQGAYVAVKWCIRIGSLEIELISEVLRGSQTLYVAYIADYSYSLLFVAVQKYAVAMMRCFFSTLPPLSFSACAFCRFISGSCGELAVLWSQGFRIHTC